MKGNFVAKNANRFNRASVHVDRKKAFIPEINDEDLTLRKPKLVILNCPPRSGKDATGEYLVNTKNCVSLSFKQRLINITLAIYGINPFEWAERYETMKEVPWDKLDGLSQRQALIKTSEEVIKPNYGKDFFGLALLQEFQKASRVMEEVDYFIVTDGGFVEELEPLIGNDVVILQWDADFSGTVTNFDNDSRDWVSVDGIPTYRLKRNSGTIEEYAEYVFAFLDSLNNKG
jgi:hypothetical protein